MAVATATALTLALMGAAEASARTPTRTPTQVLFLNHTYGVLDRETADAIETSPYLRTFANFQLRTTTGSGGEKWTARYLMGRETYLELFGVGDVPGQDGTLGSAGMGLSTEQEGDLSTVEDRLRKAGITPINFRQTRDFGDGVPVPWFDAVYTTEQYDSFGAWGMEYLPSYFADPRSDTEPPDHPGDVSRERYLSDDYRDHLMRDVSSVRLAVTQKDLQATTPLLRAGGFTVHTLPQGIVATRNGTTLRFDTTTRDHTGLKRIDLTLNHPAPPRHLRIGHSTLTIGPGPHATWTFD